MPRLRPSRAPGSRARGGRARRTPAGSLIALTVLSATLLPATSQTTTQAAGRPAQVAPSPGVTTDECRTSSEESPVLVRVTTLLPAAPVRQDQPFQVSGFLTNCGSQPLEGLAVRLAIGERLDRRSLLADAEEEPVAGTPLRTTEVDAVTTALRPGQKTTFDLRTLVSALRLDPRRNGVWPLTVQARGRYGGTGRATVGTASTFVPWLPDVPIAPTRVAWLLPLVDQPRRGAAEIFLDDALDGLLEDQPDNRGRLHRALLSGVAGSRGGVCERTASPPEGSRRDSAQGCRAEPVPLTWAVDPDLLYSVEAMVRPYTVRRGTRDVSRPASANAEAFLVALRAQAQTADVLALPYGDPDVVALARQGGLRDDLEAMRSLGRRQTQTKLYGEQADRGPLPTLAWPPPGPVGTVVDALAGDPVRPTTLVLDESAFPPLTEQVDRTRNARTTLPSALVGEVTGLVVDRTLSELVEPDPTAPDWQGERLAEQRWIAEIGALTAERPSVSRTVVVAPRRRADLLPALAAQVMADTGRLPWVCPVSLAAAAAGTEQCAAGGLADVQAPATAEDRGRPLQRGGTELDPAYLAELAQVRRRSDQFTGQVLVAGPQSAETTARLLRARGRAESSAWRQRPGNGRTILGLLDADVQALRAKIVLRAAPVLLTGRSGPVLLTVENGLDQPVNVGVRLDETTAARLVSSDTGVTEVPGRNALPIRIQVTARTSGRFEARLQLVDLDGNAFGDLETFQVTSTGYGRVALGVTGAAALVLFGAAGVRLLRRARHRARTGAPAA